MVAVWWKGDVLQSADEAVAPFLERAGELDLPKSVEARDVVFDVPEVVGVAEAYNAMTTDCPYAGAMPSRVARMVLAQEAGRQFDSSVVEAFEELLAVAPEAYRTATSAEFDLEAPTA